MFRNKGKQIHTIIYRNIAGQLIAVKHINISMSENKNETSSFSYKDKEYTIDLEAVSVFDTNNMPVLEYELDHSKPLLRGVIKKVIEKNDKGEEIVTTKLECLTPTLDNSKAFHKLFKEKMVEAVLNAMKAGKAEMPFWMPMLAGLGIGFLIAIIGYPYIIPKPVAIPVTTPTIK